MIIPRMKFSNHMQTNIIKKKKILILREIINTYLLTFNFKYNFCQHYQNGLALFENYHQLT